MSRKPLPEELAFALGQHFQQRFSRGESTRLQHGRDESVHEPLAPNGVTLAESTDEVVLLVRDSRQPDRVGSTFRFTLPLATT